MDKTLVKRFPLTKVLPLVGLSIVGCAFISICSLVKIPLYPVPFTLQTFGIFVLALTQSPKHAFASAVCYLICASIGLPVLSGKSNTLWLVQKCGGFLLSFPFAAYLASRMALRWRPIIALLCGQVVIYTMGMIWLIPMYGDQIALKQGVALFVPSDLLKNMAAIGAAHLWKMITRNR